VAPSTLRDGKEPAVLYTAKQDPQQELSVEQQVKAMFHRVIASWASDALALRRRGLDRPSTREGNGAPVAPAAFGGDWSERRYCDLPPIRWMPQTSQVPSRFGEL
jgi:hypothetical protein